jgi:mono/diheme cytochrome c family protein
MPVSARACVFSIGLLLAAKAGAAEMNGPMSSTRAADAGAASAPASQGEAQAFDVHKLFANTCGWCHSGGGRVAGKGPQLMDTTRTDAEIVNRIRNGKAGAMPAFGSTFDDAQLQAIVKYIRELKPEGAAQ